MRDLTAMIECGTQRIPAAYFQLSIDGGGSKYRERVYCYELYHQMRCIWPQGTEYYLNGEVDKAAHPILRKLGAASKKPDLLVHRPGYMEGNHAIIEVKSPTATRKGIEKDLATLSLFRTTVRYERAIYLLYGNDALVTAERVVRVAAGTADLAPFEVWLHEVPGQPARHYLTLPDPQLVR